MRKVVIVVVVLVWGGHLATNAYAGNIRITTGIDIYSGGSISNDVDMRYKTGGTEGRDSYDTELIPGMITLEAFFVNGGYEFVTETKDLNSTTPFILNSRTTENNIEGDEYWIFNVTDSNDLEWKNILAERYGKNGNIDDPNDVQDVWDVKYVDGEVIQSGYVNNPLAGLCDQVVFKPFNYSDLNRDKRVDFKDYAIFANNFGRTDPNCGADPNNLDDYSDIDRSGAVDFNDLSLFTGEWLWDANDPNTW